MIFTYLLACENKQPVHSYTLDIVCIDATISTAQKIKFPIKDFSSKCDQIRREQYMWSYLLEKSLMENFVFLCSVNTSLKYS